MKDDMNSNMAQPSQNAKTKSDLIVVLDLDECLVHRLCYGLPEGVEGMDVFLDKDPGEGTFSQGEKMTDGRAKFRYALRPHLQEFLINVCSKFAEVHLYTASPPVLGSAVLDALWPLPLVGGW